MNVLRATRQSWIRQYFSILTRLSNCWRENGSFSKPRQWPFSTRFWIVVSFVDRIRKAEMWSGTYVLVSFGYFKRINWQLLNHFFVTIAFKQRSRSSKTMKMTMHSITIMEVSIDTIINIMKMQISKNFWFLSNPLLLNQVVATVHRLKDFSDGRHTFSSPPELKLLSFWDKVVIFSIDTCNRNKYSVISLLFVFQLQSIIFEFFIKSFAFLRFFG